MSIRPLLPDFDPGTVRPLDTDITLRFHPTTGLFCIEWDNGSILKVKEFELWTVTTPEGFLELLLAVRRFGLDCGLPQRLPGFVLEYLNAVVYSWFGLPLDLVFASGNYVDWHKNKIISKPPRNSGHQPH